MKVHILGPNLRDQSRGSFHIHAEGCGDVFRSREYRGMEFNYDRSHTFDRSSLEAVAADVYQDQIRESEGYGEEETALDLIDDFYVFPCAAKLPTTEAEAAK